MRRAKAIELTLLILLVFMILYAFQTTRLIKSYTGSANPLGQDVPQYHFVVISDDTESYSWTMYLTGLQEAAIKKKAVVEICRVEDPTSAAQLDKAFEMAELSKVDGILVKLSNNQLAREQILRSHDKGIRVVTLGNDSPDSQRDAYVGTNKFNLGQTTAQIIDSANTEPANVLLILSNEFTDQNGASSNSYLNGIHEYNANSPSINSITVEYSAKKRAELIISDRIDRQKIQTVVCTDPLDALRVVKVLIDLNRVGQIQVIASGDIPEIVDYIKKKTIYASVVEDYGSLGKMSAEALYTLMKNERQSAYINIPIKVLTQDDPEGR